MSLFYYDEGASALRRRLFGCYAKPAVGKFCTEPRLIFVMFTSRLLRAVLAPLIYKGSCHAQRIYRRD